MTTSGLFKAAYNTTPIHLSTTGTAVSLSGDVNYIWDSVFNPDISTILLVQITYHDTSNVPFSYSAPMICDEIYKGASLPGSTGLIIGSSVTDFNIRLQNSTTNPADRKIILSTVNYKNYKNINVNIVLLGTFKRGTI